LNFYIKKNNLAILNKKEKREKREKEERGGRENEPRKGGTSEEKYSIMCLHEHDIYQSKTVQSFE
jgi:hypothetical protein